MTRGGVYAHATFTHRRFVVVSADPLSETGTVLVVEVADEAPTAGPLPMLAVTLTPDDGLTGVVLGWRINFTPAGRLGALLGQISPSTMDSVDVALRAALDL